MKKVFLYLCVLVLVASCSKDEPPEDRTQGIIELEKNEIPFTITGATCRLVTLPETNGINGSAGVGLQIVGEVDDGILEIVVSNWEHQNPPDNGLLLKTYDVEYGGPNSECLNDNNDFCDDVNATYYEGDFSSQAEEVGFVEITSNDPDESLISGNFNFIIHNYWYDSESVTLLWFKGTFEDLYY